MKGGAGGEALPELKPSPLLGQNIDRPGVWINNPVLGNSVPAVDLPLDLKVPFGMGGREDLDDEVRRTKGAPLLQDGKARLPYDEKVGLNDVMLREDDVERGDPELAESALAQEGADHNGQLQQDHLVA